MSKYLIKEAQIVNEGVIKTGDILINNGRIERINSNINSPAKEVAAEGKHIVPGIIDDQVHFREPGLTHKANIGSESAAAVAGGTTTFMEMPNTKPPAITIEELEKKYTTAANSAYANYSFFFGATNNNLDEMRKFDVEKNCGIKIFMGSSTGNMLVDNHKSLEAIFSEANCLIATHCEDEELVRSNMAKYKAERGENVSSSIHPIVRSNEACLKSSSYAVGLAKKHNSRLHILHISTKEELDLFRNDIPLTEKRITSEACVHHLYFDASQYEEFGNLIKCNPAIKSADNKNAIFEALLDNRIDVIATDHAPHTYAEKDQNYWDAPSGLPLVQHSLQIMLDFYYKGKIALERIVEKMSHAPAICFDIADRGFIREGYYADLVLVDIDRDHEISKENILYKCGWSPLEGKTFKGLVEKTFVSGNLVYDQGKLLAPGQGMRVNFSRNG